MAKKAVNASTTNMSDVIAWIQAHAQELTYARIRAGTAVTMLRAVMEKGEMADDVRKAVTSIANMLDTSEVSDA